MVVTLALLIAWMVAAGRSTHPFNRRWTRQPLAAVRRLAQRARRVHAGADRHARDAVHRHRVRCALVRRLDLVRAGRRLRGAAVRRLACRTRALPAGRLGVPAGSPAAAHASLHRTSTAPDASAMALRRARDRPSAATPTPGAVPSARTLGPVRIGVAIAVVAGALLAAWTEWQPQRSVEASEQAVALIKQNPRRRCARRRPGSNATRFPPWPCSGSRPSSTRSARARSRGRHCRRRCRLQPSNPETWLTLGEYDLKTDPRAAVQELRAAVYLNPMSIPAQNAYVRALRASTRRARFTDHAALRYGQAAGHRPQRAQNRLRCALASRTGVRAAPAPRTATSSKPKSSEQVRERWRV